MSKAKKKAPEMEYRFYTIEPGHYFLPKVGEGWEQEYGKGLNEQLHFHNCMEIGYCYHGTGRVLIEDREIRYTDDFFTLIPKHIPHTTISDPGTKSLWYFLFVDFEGFVEEWVSKNMSFAKADVLSLLNEKGTALPHIDHEKMAAIVRDMFSECKENKKYLEDALSLDLLMLIVEGLRLSDESKLLSKRKKKEHYLSEALDYIDMNFADNIKISTLAELCSLSESHFRRTFEEIMEMKPLDYVNFVRIKNACDLIRQGNDSMQEISFDVGYDTVSTFNRNFKKITGTTPYKWREEPKNKELKLEDFHISAKKGWEANGVTPK